MTAGYSRYGYSARAFVDKISGCAVMWPALFVANQCTLVRKYVPVAGLCGGVEGDGVAKGVQSADVVAYRPLGADAVRVVVWAQIVEHGVGFG